MAFKINSGFLHSAQNINPSSNKIPSSFGSREIIPGTINSTEINISSLQKKYIQTKLIPENSKENLSLLKSSESENPTVSFLDSSFSPLPESDSETSLSPSPSARTTATPRTSPGSTPSPLSESDLEPTPSPLENIAPSSNKKPLAFVSRKIIPTPINRVAINRVEVNSSSPQSQRIQTKIIQNKFKSIFSPSPFLENKKSIISLSDSTSSALLESDSETPPSTIRDYVQSSLGNPEKDLERLLKKTYPNKGNISELASLRREIQELSTIAYIENISKTYKSHKSRSSKHPVKQTSLSPPLPSLLEEEKISEAYETNTLGSLRRTLSFSQGLGDFVKLTLSNQGNLSERPPEN